MIICDSQVHAPDRPRTGHTSGIDPADLLREMDAAHVDRCVIVPLEAPGDQSANNPAAVDMARASPERFAVMGRFDFKSEEKAGQLATWKQEPGMLGIRMAFLREPNLSLLVNNELEWFWTAAEDANIPLMILAPEALGSVEQVAMRHPRLRIVLDHLNLVPYKIYEDLTAAVRPLLGLSRLGNVAVKASCLPSAVADKFPFTSVHAPVLQVVRAFGAQRVFWGSDLSRLTCPYVECVDLFRVVLPFSAEERAWILGRGVMEFLGWNA